MRDLHVIVSNKVATYLNRDGNIVCGNSNYRIVFTFDSEWDGHNQKVARFIWNNGYHDVPFTGDTVTVPILNNTKQLKVGVYAGELRTTTPAVIECQLSILCGTTEAKPLIPSQYDEVMARIAEMKVEARTDVPANAAQMKALTIGGETFEVVDEQARTEVQGIRTGFDGTVYETAGEAVRGQIEKCVKYEVKRGNNLFDESSAIHGSQWNVTTGDSLVTNNYTSQWYACSVAVEGVSAIAISYVKHTDMSNPQIHSYFEVYEDGTISAPITPSNQYAWTQNFTISENTAEVRLNIKSANLLLTDFNIMVNEGTEVLPYEPYESGIIIPSVTEKLNKIDPLTKAVDALTEDVTQAQEQIEALEEKCVTYELVQRKNLFDESTAVRGSWWNASGVLQANAYTGRYYACSIPINGQTTITIGITTDGATAQPLLLNYFEVYADGTISSEFAVNNREVSHTFSISSNVVEVRVNLNTGEDTTITITKNFWVMVNEGTEALPYEPYGTDKLLPGVAEIAEKVEAIRADVEAMGSAPRIVLGKTIHAVVGDTLQVFYDSIFDGNWKNLVVMFKCAKGKNYPRYWEYTPTAADVGSHTITIQLLSNTGFVQCEYSGVLMVAKAANPSSTVNVLCVGDSTMQNGNIPIEASRRLKGTAGVATAPAPLNLSKINFVGRKRNAEETVGWEGTGGWSYGSYIVPGYTAIRFTVSGATNVNIGDVYSCNGFNLAIAEINVTNGTGNIRCLFDHTTSYTSAFDATAQSGTLTLKSGNGQGSVAYTAWQKEKYQPFWNVESNSFDIKGYADDYCNGEINVMCVLLGINGLINAEPFANVSIADAKTLFRNVHSQLPNCKILASTVPLASVNGGIAANYGAGSASGAYSANGMNRKVFDFNELLISLETDSEFASYVSVINSHAQFDAENGYPTTTKPINTRISATETLQSNAVHPSMEGYWQLADALAFRAVLATIS